MARMGEYAGIAVFSAERLIRKAITTAAHAASGQKFPERGGDGDPVHVSPPEAGGTEDERDDGQGPESASAENDRPEARTRTLQATEAADSLKRNCPERGR